VSIPGGFWWFWGVFGEFSVKAEKVKTRKNLKSFTLSVKVASITTHEYDF
jgi:hypothetical protein